jgi:inhibitor of KinA
MIGDHRIHWEGDSAVVVAFEERIDVLVNGRAVAVAGWIEAARLPGVRDVVPTFCAVTVYVDPLRVNHEALMTTVAQAAREATPAEDAARPPTRVPVCYGSEFGPDLESVAAWSGLGAGEVVARHANVAYRVFMLGFVPGFAYLGLVDPRIAMPRREVPRVRVPRGSVALAGVQTGVYPSDVPGGWQIIGRTPVTLFDPALPDPCRLTPGDTVEFHPISAQEYARMVDRTPATA